MPTARHPIAPTAMPVSQDQFRQLQAQVNREGTTAGGTLLGATAPYVYVQVTQAAEWVVNHNLGYRPLIDVLSPGGVVVDAEVRHISTNQANIYFSSGATGSAIAR